jgi:hypothetical protein
MARGGEKQGDGERPLAVRATREVGADISGQGSKTPASMPIPAAIGGLHDIGRPWLGEVDRGVVGRAPGSHELQTAFRLGAGFDRLVVEHQKLVGL